MAASLDISYQHVLDQDEYFEGYHLVNGDVRKIFELKGLLLIGVWALLAVAVWALIGKSLALSFVGVVAFVYGFLFLRYARVRSRVRSGKESDPELSVRIDDLGIAFSKEGAEQAVSWGAFIKYHEGELVVLLFLSDKEFVTVPKRYLGDALRQLVETLRSQGVPELANEKRSFRG